MIEEYVVGQPVTYRATFYSDPERTILIDPEVVTLIVNPPTEEEFELDVSPDDPTPEEGSFSATHIVTEHGDWNYRWETENPVIVVQGVYHVSASNV